LEGGPAEPQGEDKLVRGPKAVCVWRREKQKGKMRCGEREMQREREGEGEKQFFYIYVYSEREREWGPIISVGGLHRVQGELVPIKVAR
jgi:hypothetical protein